MADQPGPEARPEPVKINSVPIIVIGTASWLLGFLVLLPFYSTLGHHHHRVWLWTCLAGFVLGFIGYAMMRRHRNAGRTI